MNDEINSITVIIPAYNEERGLEKLLPKFEQPCVELGWKVIVVNDGSNDNTANVVERIAPWVKLINLSHNHGYGAAIKIGIRAAKTQWIAMCDADGQHEISDLKMLCSKIGEIDAIIGCRTSDSHKHLSRIPGKFILNHLANFIIGHSVPDINCGLRVIRREAILSIMGLTSDAFSFSTSTLLALIKTNRNIIFVPVTLQKRIGKSSVRQVKDGLNTLLLITRLIVLFDPMRLFIPISALLILTATLNQIYVMWSFGANVSKSTVLLFISGIVMFSFALLADQIASLRREIAMFDQNHQNR